jgi:hypothetical protein
VSDDPFVRYGVRTLFHFCDRQNLPLIREHGGLYSLEYLDVMGITVPVPGGNDWSHEVDRRKGLHRYVHLCFHNRHPMEYRAREAGRIQNSIFLRIDSAVLKRPGVMITDDVSNKAGVILQPLDRASELIDFEVLFTRKEWRDPVIKARLQKARKSEILVPDFIPIALIRNLPE